MMKHGYIGKFEIIDDHRAGKIVVNLTGRLNKCGVINTRFDIQLKDLEKWQTDSNNKKSAICNKHLKGCTRVNDMEVKRGSEGYSMLKELPEQRFGG
ncbi:hypothetical protein H8959_007296 [Pygathrix nigripes]